jgi:hypothetical protein
MICRGLHDFQTLQNAPPGAIELSSFPIKKKCHQTSSD